MRIHVFTAILACLALAAGCKKKEPVEPRLKETVVQISIRNEAGNPLGGIPVLVFDEAGYERFRKDYDTKPREILLSAADGSVTCRFPAGEWLTEGARIIHFVIFDRLDESNIRIWAIARTIGVTDLERVEFRIDPFPDPDAGTPVDLYDEKHGHTLFAGAAYVDAQHYLCGGNRYSFVDAGKVAGLEALGDPEVEGFADRTAVHPGHGYFMYKDISLMKFPSGRWGVSVATEFAKAYVVGWLYRDGKAAGVSLRYSKHKPAEHGLPEWGQQYDVQLSGDRSATISLPGAGRCEFAAKQPEHLAIEAADGRATIRVTDAKASPGREYPLYIRSGNYYTETKIRVMD